MSKYSVLFLSAMIFLVGVGAATVGEMSGANADTAETPNIRFYPYDNGYAAGGYDVIAYFDQSEAVKGEMIHEEEWGGQKWLFSSDDNRARFAAEPLKYMPQYGGHCAYGVAQGYLVRGEPLAWSIRDDKLYLNYSRNIRTAWLADAEAFIRRSEKSWPTLNR